MQSLISIFLIGALLLTATPVAFAGTDVRTYEIPDIREEYCGIHVNFQYCKCAFHNQYCDSVGTDKSGARAYVLDSFQQWNRERIQTMGEQCLKGEGHWDKNAWSCTICTDGEVLNGSKCVVPDSQEEKNRQCDLPSDFDQSWRKYSDFDEAISVSTASYEVQEYNRTLEEIADLTAQAQTLEYDMEIDREIRLELRQYKQALVQNIRNNITKAIFRLAWVTYNAVQAGKGAAGSYTKLLNPENTVEGLGAAMKLVQSHIPQKEKELQFDTSSTAGKVKSIAWNATLEAIESVGSPSAVAQQALKDVKGAIVPGPDLSEEEISILAAQHLKNQAIDQTLAESYAVNAKRRTDLLALEKQIAEKYNQLQEWKAKEYTRVRTAILEDCQQ